MSIREFAVINYRNICVCFMGVILLFTVNNKVFAEDSYASAVSVITTVINQHTILSQTFSRVDNFMSLPEKKRVLMQYNNKYAYTGAGQQVFSPTFIPDEKAGVWIRSFVLFEQIPLNNGPNVSNVGYATAIGADTDLKHYKNGWDAAYTAHVTFQGSRENFNTTSSVDTLGNVGLTGAFFKNNFFTAVTAIVGGDYTHDAVGLGEQTFRLFTASGISKTGYNFEFKQGKYILQPNLLVDYIYVLPSDFISSDGQSSTGDPVNAMHVSPGIKLIGNFKDGWQPYLSLSETWTLMDSPAIYRNGVLQPRVSINPYVEYGFGLQRRWKEKYTSFGQVLMRGGGRNGVSMYFGFRVAFGKEGTKIKKKEPLDNLKNTQDKMNGIKQNEEQDKLTNEQNTNDDIKQVNSQNNNTDEKNEPTQEQTPKCYPCY